MKVDTQLGSVMSREMHEQPDVVRELLRDRRDTTASIRTACPEKPVGILLTARGSSDNAAVFGRYLFERQLQRPAGLIAPSLWTRYGSAVDLSGYLVIGLSQSGQTPEVEQVLTRSRTAGAVTIAITNDRRAPLGQTAACVVPLGAGAERAVPATKTFTAQVVALMLVADALGKHCAVSDVLPLLQEHVLGDSQATRSMTGLLARSRAVVMVGSGLLHGIALEAALKFIETTSIPALAYSANDFLHGPIAVAAPDVPVVCFAAEDAVRPDVERVVGAAEDRGAPVVWVGDRPPCSVTASLPVPYADEAAAVLMHTIRAQQIALEVSRALGRDPDHPRGLKKVTLT